MEEVDELLGIKSEEGVSVQPEDGKKSDGENADSPKDDEVTVNGRTYDLTDPEQAKQLAKDTTNLTKKLDEQGRELGELRKKVPADKVEDKEEKVTLTPEAKAKLKEVFKQEFGLVDKTELDTREYVKAANTELDRIGSIVGKKKSDLIEEITAAGVKMPVSQYETYMRGKYPEEFAKHKKEQISQSKPAIPYTERPNKEGAELQSGGRIKFGQNLESAALELIGAKGE